MDKRDAKDLLSKYNSGNCTEEEKALLESWYLEWQGGEFDLSNNELELMKTKGLEQILKSRKKNHVLPYWTSYAAAAAVILAIISFSVFQNNSKRTVQQSGQQQTAQALLKNDAVPGGNKALLTLADGTVVPLDEIESGRIAQVAGMTIRKTADGQIVYEAAPSSDNNADNGAISYNQITTPRGGQYKIILPDGTKVWLNAASTLKYPVQFTASARQVELKGEGYFEVNKQQTPAGKRIPFFVNTSSQTVEVLGTHFNINSYADEAAVVTTLLEGAVKISYNSFGVKSSAEPIHETILKPGQQAAFKDKSFVVKTVNTEEAVAWKKGYFSFEDADLQTVMRQLSRWYDVDVVYNGEISSETFTGKVQRNMTLVKVLDILSYAQINYKMEGKKLIITP